MKKALNNPNSLYMNNSFFEVFHSIERRMSGRDGIFSLFYSAQFSNQSLIYVV